VRRLTVVTASVLICLSGTIAVARQQDVVKSLHDAAAAGDVAQIQQYVDKKADLDAVDSFGFTPLMRAVRFGHVEAAKALVDGGANPNLAGGEGTPPLCQACTTGNKEIVDVLLAAKADTKVKNRNGWAPLHCAVQAGRVDIVESLIAAGADVNATNAGGQTPLSIAQQRANMPEMADLLKQHGGTVPVMADPYGQFGPNGPTAQGPGSQSDRPSEFAIDPNAIREELAKFAALDAPLKAVDANSEAEQRAWITRRTDNRTLLIRAVQKQFEQEMVFLKGVATEEKAAKTTKAIDDLVTARKKRYEKIAEELRQQRRQTLQETRDSAAAGSGTMSRGGRGMTRSRPSTAPGGGTMTPGQNSYGSLGTQARASRRGTTPEPAAPAVSAETQAQMDAWLNATGENKAPLLENTFELDFTEYMALHDQAEQEKAAKTQVAVMALLMLRDERIGKIVVKWQEEDERNARMQERAGTNAMPGAQQGTQQGYRRGGRR